jgi:hypothetical protein
MLKMTGNTANKSRRKWASLLIGAPIALVVGFVSSASASTLTFGLDFEFSGASAPASSTTPWVTITLDDSFGDANTVRMTVATPNLTGGTTGENVNSFFLNFEPSLDSSLLTFNSIDNGDSVPTGIGVGDDLFQADGDGFFDIEFMMPQPPGAPEGLFTGGETIVYDIIFPSAISAFSFAHLSVNGGGQGSFGAAAQIQRISGNGGESGWIGTAVIPEPSTALLLGMGMLGLGLQRRQAR